MRDIAEKGEPALPETSESGKAGGW